MARDDKRSKSILHPAEMYILNENPKIPMDSGTVTIVDLEPDEDLTEEEFPDESKKGKSNLFSSKTSTVEHSIKHKIHHPHSHNHNTFGSTSLPVLLKIVDLKKEDKSFARQDSISDEYNIIDKPTESE